MPNPDPIHSAVLRAKHVALRARHPDDVAILQAELYDDVATRAQADSRQWRPIPPDPSLSPYAVSDTEDTAFFSIIAITDGELVGEALLWGIDPHNWLGHLGLLFAPRSAAAAGVSSRSDFSAATDSPFADSTASNLRRPQRTSR